VFSKITPSLFTIKEGSTSSPSPSSSEEGDVNRSSSSLLHLGRRDHQRSRLYFFKRLAHEGRIRGMGFVLVAVEINNSAKEIVECNKYNVTDYE
ncbi:hypothetical protein, partial [Prevotella sp.]|uniref:hypothetical protein n=1 Tax=Prevotella sp. TaxID=59823 RepID=UPI003F80A3B5